MKLLVYRCTLQDATNAVNNGCVTLDFIDLSVANNGRDDFDAEVAGTLEVADCWQLAISQRGDVLFENIETGEIIVPTGEYGEGITTLSRKYKGFKYRPGDLSGQALADTEEWQKLEQAFIESIG